MRTLAHKYFEIESDIYKITKEDYKSLDILISKAKRINTKDKPTKIVLNISNFLIEEGFESRPIKPRKAEDVFYLKFKNKKIDCKDYAVLYYSIGEELNLPLDIVFVPKHFFIRWTKDGTTFNWETTNNKIMSDEEYVSYFKISKDMVDKGIFLKKLNGSETLGEAYCVLGNAKSDLALDNPLIAETLKLDGVSDITKAIKLDPRNPEYYLSRANIYLELLNLDKAYQDCTRTIDLYPDFTLAYLNIVSIKLSRFDYWGAKSYFQKALEVKPNDFFAIDELVVDKGLNDFGGFFEKYKTPPTQ